MSRFARTLALFLVATPFLAWSQTFDEYIQLRKKYGISSSADADALNSFVGNRVMEVKGTVTGVVGSGDSEILMLVGPEGEQHFVSSTNTPDWLKSGSVPARLIVQASRDSEHALLHATLIGAASESTVAAYEAKTAKPLKAPLSGRIGGSKSSRKGGRPQPMQGDVPRVTTNPVGQPPTNISANLSAALPQYVAFVKQRNKRLTDDQAQRIAQSILAYSAHFGVDARLIVAIIITESDFNPNTTSRAGAMGLGQLMPVNKRELGLTDAYDIEQNLWGTVRLVRGHIDKYSAQTDDSFEALVLALAGYNAGNGAVKKYGGVPPYRETQNYVRKVIGIYRQLCGK
ncbi:MAG: lytic transglycosylase domain-containing protein [Armatimonadetes bacterium]|nr:lytic transglycosylase domain-containing protein [Armatimonadota bacterium]